MGLDFLVLYEHIAREFDNNCLLMAELRRRGYSVELMQLMSRKKLRYFLFKKPRVIISSAMYDNETLNSFVYNNVGKLNKVINLHWEEVLSREQEESDFYSLRQNAAKCTHICWGEAARERIIARGVSEGNAVVTGAIHLDFLRGRLRDYSNDRLQLADRFGLDPEKNWILYISSFSCASMDDREIEELNAMTDLDFKGFQQVGARSMSVTLDWLDRLMTDRPGNVLIYRPHPSEWESPPLLVLEKKHGDFKVIRDFSIREWILSCDDIFIWMSTSIAEVYFAKKTCMILRPEPLYEDYDPVVYEGCDAVASYESLLFAFDNPSKPFPVDGALLESHYSLIEDYPSYKRIADLCEDVYKNEPRDLPFSEGYVPRFNLLKFIALFCLNLMVTLRIKPEWFAPLFGKRFTSYAARLTGYIEKSRVKKRAVEAKIEELGGFLE
ncbi:MAG: hypothetical protein FWE66_03705 [Oscillospiraceae bacterium]|nr:hypothetical protein [Oscillospiraceae bacterium]